MIHRPTTSSSARTAQATARASARGTVIVVAAGALVALGGCGSPPRATPVTTVTVFADETSTPGDPATTKTPSVGPSSVPTVTAPATATVAPTLAVGKLRGAPRNFAEASARVAKAPVAAAAASSFVSPTGNIFCAVSSDSTSVACEVSGGRIPAPASAPCPAGDGARDIGRVELSAEGAIPVCNSDTIRASGAGKLAYGQRSAAPGTGFSCLSETYGVTCVDTAGKHGFFLARDTFATF